MLEMFKITFFMTLPFTLNYYKYSDLYLWPYVTVF